MTTRTGRRTSLRVGAGISTRRSGLAATEDALGAALAPLDGAIPDLAFLFVAPQFEDELESIIESANASLGGGTLLGCVVLEFPFMPQSVAGLGQPFGVVPQCFNLDAGKVFYGTCRWPAQRFQKAEADQDWNVIWFKAEPPGGFSRGEPPRKTGQGQDFFAFGIMASPW